MLSSRRRGARRGELDGFGKGRVDEEREKERRKKIKTTNIFFFPAFRLCNVLCLCRGLALRVALLLLYIHFERKANVALEALEWKKRASRPGLASNLPVENRGVSRGS